MTRPDETKPTPADEIELKRWHPQPEPDLTAEPAAVRDASDGKSFHKKHDAHDRGAVSPKTEAKLHEPHAKAAEAPLSPDEKHDHLAARTPEVAEKPKKRQDALIDEGLEETFPASDPVSVKHIT
jgi:hypothetical protein